ncbi:MAG: HEPN domain-containing protein [Wenzhouxiangellaceae bacterium]|nr:HEPN domain-containing protein [Wenzhouxiangellaceae bacterium]
MILGGNWQAHVIPHQTLKTRQRAERDQWPTPLALRVHRALSWLERAERCSDDDGRFVFLWIAFNSAYAAETGSTRPVEAQRFSDFLGRLVGLDEHRRLPELIWRRYSSAIRLLLSNQYVFQPYWDHQNGIDNSEKWEERFSKANTAAHAALGRHDTGAVLSIVFSRLYTLRNQLLHGGATWNSGINRDQLRDGSAILGDVVPVLIEIMMDHPGELWGEPSYPVVSD